MASRRQGAEQDNAYDAPQCTNPLFPSPSEHEYGSSRHQRRVPSPDRQSLRTSSSRSTGEQRTGLSRLSRQFIDEVSYRDIDEAIQFIQEHREILGEAQSNPAFLTEATNAIQKGDVKHGKNVLEKALMLHDLASRRSSEDKSRYLRMRLQGDRDLNRKVERDMAKLFAACEERASARERKRGSDATSIESRMSYMSIRADDIPTQELRRQHTGARPDYARGSGPVAYGARVYAAGQRQESEDPEQIPGIPDRQTSQTSRISPRSPEPKESIGRRGNTVSFSPDVENRDGEYDHSDDRFHRRTAREAARFFKVGRVFAMFFYDVGPRRQRSPIRNRLNDDDPGRAHVARMAVVKEGHGYCWTVPITTYDGQGLVMRGLREPERQAHAIIHMADKPPVALEGEGRLSKLPIAIEPSSPESKLHKASRINFAKVHSIEHNVRAMNVGKVSPESMPHFLTYFRYHIDN